MVYDNMHRIVSKHQKADAPNTYRNQYSYTGPNGPPYAVKEISNLDLPGNPVTDRFTYDLNGNTTQHQRMLGTGQNKIRSSQFATAMHYFMNLYPVG